VLAHLDGVLGDTTHDPFFPRNEIIVRDVVDFGGGMVYTSDCLNGSCTSGYDPAATIGWDSFQFSNQTASGFDFVGKYTVSDGQMLVGTSALGLTVIDASADFSNTSTLSLMLPTGVSFTSDSGVFLSGLSASAPEPAAWIAMLAGFGLVGAAFRRRRRDLRELPIRTQTT